MEAIETIFNNLKVNEAEICKKYNLPINKKKILIVVPDKDISSTDKSLKDYNLCTKKDFNSKVTRLPVFKKTTPKSDCYILFTSGSTGVPKGVPINNKNVISYLKNSLVYAH